MQKLFAFSSEIFRFSAYFIVFCSPFSVGNKTFRCPSRSDMMLNSLEDDRDHLFICRHFSAFKVLLTLKESS